MFREFSVVRDPANSGIVAVMMDAVEAKPLDLPDRVFTDMLDLELEIFW